MVDPLVLDDEAVLNNIMYNSSTSPSSYPVWESCVFPMREQQIFLAFFSVHPHLIKQICAKNAFLDKTLTHLNTVQCYIIGQEKVVPFVSEKKASLERGPFVIDENSKMPYKMDVNISDTKERKEKEVSHR